MGPVNSVLIFPSKNIFHYQFIYNFSGLSVNFLDFVLNVTFQRTGQDKKISVRLFFDHFMVVSTRHIVHGVGASQIIHLIEIGCLRFVLGWHEGFIGSNYHPVI